MRGNKTQVDCYNRNWGDSVCGKQCSFFDDCYWESKDEEKESALDELDKEMEELQRRIAELQGL